MIKAVIFDWDGVISDSMSWIAQAIQETALSYGVKVDIDDILDGYFQPRNEYYSSLGIDITDNEELNRRHTASIDKYGKISPLFLEVENVLKFLKKRNFILGVCSYGRVNEIIKQLKFFGLEDIFPEELILGENLNSKEEKLQKFIEKFGISSDELLYVGDLPSDITSGRIAKVKVAGIGRREIVRERLSALKPDYLFSSLNDLKLVLEKY